jgi:hypothetical protein
MKKLSVGTRPRFGLATLCVMWNQVLAGSGMALFLLSYVLESVAEGHLFSISS